MAFPVGVSVAIIEAGRAFTSVGSDVSMSAKVTPIFRATDRGTMKRIVHAATGHPMLASTEEFKAEAGSVLSFAVPHVDQPGWQAPSGEAYTMWYYAVEITARVGNGRNSTGHVWKQNVQPLVGQDFIDLDLIADGPTGEPVTAPQAVVTDVEGQTGSVVIGPIVGAAIDQAVLDGRIPGPDVTEVAPGEYSVGGPGIIYGLTPNGDLPASTIDGLDLRYPTIDELAEVQENAATRDVTVYFGKDQGIVADGVTDDSAAFLTAYNNLVAATVAGGIAGGNRRSRVTIKLPAGRILLTQANALMNAATGSRSMGYTIEGAGRSLTEIVWKPATAGTPLLRNNDVWMQVTLRGMTFISDTPGANFMHSSSNGGAQDYLFEECSWSGNWGYGLGLDGTGPTTANNNSEIEFRRCTFAGSYNTAFLWSGMTAGNTQQDQFLNFTFSTCNVVLLSGGTFGRWDYGGAIYFNDSNVMLDGGAQLFDLRGSSHANGAQLLKVDGGRAELRNDAVKILTCGWGRGNVVFNGWDEEANYLIVSQSVVTHSYNPASLGGPTVRYQACAFSGRHEYAHGANSYTASRSITYDGCTLPTEPHTFVQTTGASNPGGRAVITFRRTRSRANNPTGTTSVALDQTLGWWEGIGSQPERRSAVFRPSSATLHNTATVTLTIPRNAMVTAVRFYKKAGVGASTVTNWSYRVESSESTPTVLATCAGEGTIQWAAGFSKTVPVENFVCDADDKRALKLIPTSVPELATGIQGFVVVEYLA